MVEAQPVSLRSASNDGFVAVRQQLDGLAPYVGVLAVIAFNLWELRAETTPVTYLNDSSVHVQMVRSATALIRAGHLPLTSWFPYLSLGSAQFLHYQSLGAMVTGVAGLVVSPNVAFSWSIYLLVSLWPACVFFAARLFGLTTWQSAGAAILSPFITSVIGVGYEQASYLFVGFGIWTQLWAMWTLPFAWAFSWRAVHAKRSKFLAVLFIALTIAFHFITGYLALLALIIWPFVTRQDLFRRVFRSVVIGIGALLASAWVIVPLIHFEKWAALNEALQNTPDSNSYGARQVLNWLFTGHIFDANRLPVITVLFFVGLLACLRNWRREPLSRALLLIFGASLVLFFGKPTLGPLIDAIPGHRDVFFRRFIMGVQFSGVLIAGIGLLFLVTTARSILRSRFNTIGDTGRQDIVTVFTYVLATLVLVTFLYPAWNQIRGVDDNDGAYIHFQHYEDAAQGPKIATLVAAAKAHGPGRVYAGTPGNWGPSFAVGSVPVFKYVESLDVDEVGYTLRTQSLMTGPEQEFDSDVLGDFSLFGIRYVIAPDAQDAPAGARLIRQDGPYRLWELHNIGYFQVVDTTRPIIENRTDIGILSGLQLDSTMPAQGIYPTVAYDGGEPATATLNNGTEFKTTPGSVLAEHVNSSSGVASATINASRASVVLLKMSYDPGWRVTVDGVAAPTEMLAPALLGVKVTAGHHVVVFRYVGYATYPVLFAISLLALVSFALTDWWRLRRDL